MSAISCTGCRSCHSLKGLNAPTPSSLSISAITPCTVISLTNIYILLAAYDPIFIVYIFLANWLETQGGVRKTLNYTFITGNAVI